MGSVVSSDKLFVCGRESLNCTPIEVPSEIQVNRDAVIPTVKQEVEYPAYRVPMDEVGFPFPQYATGIVVTPAQCDDVIPYPPSPIRDNHNVNTCPHVNDLGYLMSAMSSASPFTPRPTCDNSVCPFYRPPHLHPLPQYMPHYATHPMSEQELGEIDKEFERKYAAHPSLRPIRPMTDQEFDMIDQECQRRYAAHPSLCPSYRPNGVCRAVPLQGNETIHESISPFDGISPEEYEARVKKGLASKFPKKKRSRKQRRHNNRQIHVFLDPTTDPRIEHLITDEYDRTSFKSFMANFKMNCDNAQSYNQIYESILSKYTPKEEIVIPESPRPISKEELDEQLDDYMSKHPIFQKPID